MARALAGDVRPTGFLTGGAPFARALLGSGLLPVFPARPERYDLGPLRRAEAPSARQEPPRRRPLALGPAGSGSPSPTVPLLALVTVAVVLGRAGAWRRAIPSRMAKLAAERGERVWLWLLIRLSRARRARRRLLALARASSGLLPARPMPSSPATWPARPRGPSAAPPRRGVPEAGRQPTLAAADQDLGGRVPLRLSGRGRGGRKALLLGALGAAAAAVAAALLVPLVTAPPDFQPALRTARAADDGSDGPATTAAVSPRSLPPAPVAAEPPARVEARPEPYRIAWPFDIADALTFGPEGATKTRLAGLDGPSRDAICNDREGRPWACGLQARAALNNITRQQQLVCDPAGAPTASLVPARCRGEVDVARELVLAGFARPNGPEPALEAALEDARRNERGLWNGGWTIRAAIR